jgi:hypothetical protein
VKDEALLLALSQKARGLLLCKKIGKEIKLVANCKL